MSRYAITGGDDSAYKRLSRVIDVPAGGGELSFYVTRDTEPAWDFFFVEARPVGTEDWTTLPDLNNHTSQDTGASCPDWLEPAPVPRPLPDRRRCRLVHPERHHRGLVCGERGQRRLRAVAARPVGVRRDVGGGRPDAGQRRVGGVQRGLRRRRGRPGGAGSTSFEADADPLDGWTVPGPPPGSPGNASDWRTASEAAGPSTGENAEAALARQPEIIDFLDDILGRYPFGEAGGIVDNDPGIGFALENQTRPIYAQGWFSQARRQHVGGRARARPPVGR